MKIKLISKCFIIAGLLLFAAALFLTVYNLNEQTQAAHSAASALVQMEHAPAVTANTAGEDNAAEPVIPDYLRDPNMPMPELEIDGELYVGIVSIPALELRLPVISEWSYPRLKIAPCRFQGSAYLDDLIVMAHNYAGHFGGLINLQLGDEVYFEDMAGNVFRYEVAEMETLATAAIDKMLAGDWDLTLFTCTIGGQSRVTVRCERANTD